MGGFSVAGKLLQSAALELAAFRFCPAIVINLRFIRLAATMTPTRATATDADRTSGRGIDVLTSLLFPIRPLESNPLALVKRGRIIPGRLWERDPVLQNQAEFVEIASV